MSLKLITEVNHLQNIDVTEPSGQPNIHPSYKYFTDSKE